MRRTLPPLLLGTALCAGAGLANAGPRPLVPVDQAVGPISSRVWSPPSMLTPLASFGATRVGDWVYVYSGHMGPTHHHSQANLSPAFARLNLQAGGGWELLPCPIRLQSAVLVAHKGKLIRVGGMSAKNASDKEQSDLHSVKSVQRFDPFTRKWESLPDLPEPRSSHGALVQGDKLYVYGGWNVAGDDATWHRTGWALDLAQPKLAWTPAPKPGFTPRRALQAQLVGGRLVILGGMLEKGRFTSEVHALDLAQGTWSQLPKLPCMGFGVGATVLGSKLYVSGIDSKLFALDLKAAKPAWQEAASLIFPRYFHELIPLGPQRILALGGVTRPLRSRANVHLRASEVIELTPQAPRMTSWTLPNPGLAKNRQGVFLFFDSLWFFGGNKSTKQHDFGAEFFLDQGWRFHLATQRFEPLPPFPHKRQSMRTLVLPGKTPRGLSVGGFGHEGKGTRLWDTAYTYDFKTKAWTPYGARMPRSRTQFALIPKGDAVYAFGGLDYARQRKRSFQFPLEVVKLTGGKIAGTPIRLPRPRRAFGGARLGEKVYLVGGMGPGFSLIKEVDVYDFQTKTWGSIPAPKNPRISPHLLALGGKLYLIGGTTPQGGRAFTPNQSVEVFDPATQAWTTWIEELPISVRHMRFFAWRERILCETTQLEGPRALRILVLQP